jgi:arylformamidase
MLFEHNVAMVESLTNLDKLQSTRFEMIILPLPVEGLDSCPVRVIAIEK